MSPFLPVGHPWRGRWFGLREWYDGRTPLTIAFDSFAWGVIVPTWAVLLLIEVLR